ncbi:hypothetical protein VTI74DRAFT_5125 [Chaetomium olivicolor]
MKHTAALVALISLASAATAASLPNPPNSVNARDTPEDLKALLDKGVVIGIVPDEDDAQVQPQKRDPKLFGKKKGPSSSSNNNNNGGDNGSFGKDVASGVISGGILAGAEEAINAGQAEKRDPRRGGRLGGFGKDILSDVISGGIVTGAQEVANQGNVAKRDPAIILADADEFAEDDDQGQEAAREKRAIIPQTNPSPFPPFKSALKTSILDTDDDEVQHDKRDRRGGRFRGSAGRFGKNVASDIVSDGIVTSIEQAANAGNDAPVAKRDPRGGKKKPGSSSSSSSSAGDFAKDVAAGTASGGILLGAEELANAAAGARKRSPSPDPKRTKVKTGFFKDVASGLLDSDILSSSSSAAGATTNDITNQNSSKEDQGQPAARPRSVDTDGSELVDKRNPRFGGLFKGLGQVFKGIFKSGGGGGGGSDSGSGEQQQQKRGTVAAARSETSAGKKLGKEIGAAIVKSGAGETMKRNGVAVYFVAGLAAVVVANVAA